VLNSTLCTGAGNLDGPDGRTFGLGIEADGRGFALGARRGGDAAGEEDDGEQTKWKSGGGFYS
jgi:hypothetical protein